jgi:hypothetical protein
MLNKSLVIGALLAVGLTAAAQAQSPYPGYYAYPAPPVPSSWNYDPYTSGLGPCPQRRPGDEQCRYTIRPTYGQPDFWPGH